MESGEAILGTEEGVVREHNNGRWSKESVDRIKGLP